MDLITYGLLNKAKANLDSPAFTGTPTAPTPATTDNTTKLATTEFVRSFVATLKGFYLGVTTTALVDEVTTNPDVVINGETVTAQDGNWVIADGGEEFVYSGTVWQKFGDSNWISVIGNTYNSALTYNTGDYVIYMDGLYKCKEDNVTGDWNSTKWQATTITHELENIPQVEANPVEAATAELNTLKVLDNVYSVGNAHFMPISQEDYDDLTDEEINNGIIYFIYDAPALEVTANPEDDPEQPLVKLSIDGVIYYVPAELPEVTAEDDGKILKVVDGAWVAAAEVDPTSIIDDTTSSSDSTWSSEKIEEEIDSKSVTKEASGNPIEITDAADAPLVKCVTEITGSQDLHGYDKPWVGGAGKNLVEDKISGMNISSGGVIGSQSSYDIQIAKVVQGVTYTFTTDDSAKVCAFYSSKPVNGSTSYDSSRQTGNSTVTAPITGYIAFRTNANYAYAQCEKGETATSYAPYSNICPITAYTEGEIEVRGRNLVDISSFEIGTFNEGRPIGTPYNDCKQVSVIRFRSQNAIKTYNAPITISCHDDYYVFVLEFDENLLYTGIYHTWSSATTVTAPYIGIIVRRTDEGAIAADDYDNCHLMVEKGSSATTYEPYTSTTHTTTYPSAIYRGSEDVVNGTVGANSDGEMWLVADLGDLTWTVGSTTQSGKVRFRTDDITDLLKPSGSSVLGQVICEQYAAKTSTEVYNCIDGIAIEYVEGFDHRLWIYDESKASLTGAQFKTAMSGVKIAYRLATPTTTSVTPTNLPIKSLSGYNHIESSTGDMEVEYITDTYQPLVDLPDNVVPNPEGEATDTLEKIKIENTIYDFDNFSGDYNDLTNKPTLGTVSSKDVAASGNASSTQVVMGNDTRLTDRRGSTWGQINGTLANQTDLKGALDDIGNRIDGIVALPDGSTTADAELVDIRTGVHGATFSSAGDAVRANSEQLYAMKTGFDGVVYGSPAAMVQGCDQKLQDEITNYAKHTHISFDPILFSAYDFYKKSNSISAGTTFSPYVECVTDYTAYNSATAGSSGSYGFRYKIADGLGPLKSSSNLKVTVIIKSSIARNVRLILSTGNNWNTNTAHIQTKDISITTGLNIIPVELTAEGNMDVTETRYKYFFLLQRSAYSNTADMEVLLFGSDVVANSLHNFETSSIINELKNYSENKRVSFSPILLKGYRFYKGSNSATLGANYEPFVERVTDYSAYNSATAGSSSTRAFTYMIADKYMVPKSQTSVDVTVIIKSSVAREIKLLLSTAGSWNTETVHMQTASFNVNVGINIIPLSLTPEGNYSTTATVYNHLIVEERSNRSDTADFTIELYGSRDVGDILLQYQAFIPTSNDYRLVFWGDSLTAGAGGGGTTYPAVCASELGNLSFFNGGVGGETANTIAARMGANSFILPAGNINGTYSIDAFKDDFGKNINPLRQGTAGVNPIKVNGVECELSISQESSTDPNATYTISGYSGNALAYDSFIECAGSHITGDITIIFVGQNGPSDLDERFAIIDSMIEKAATKKYVVLGISSGQDSNRSEMDAAYLKRYGGHLLLTRKMLVEFGLAINGLTPTAQDTADIEIGKVPESLRNTDDNIHLNAYGYTALGKILANKIRSLGYLD